MTSDKGGKNMIEGLVRKGLVVGIIVLFVSAGIFPNISGNIGEPQLLFGDLPEDDFDEEVYKVAKQIATRCSPIATGIVKQMVLAAEQIPLDVGLEMESYGSGLAFSTEDVQEGVMAFMQKRKPEFKNR